MASQGVLKAFLFTDLVDSTQLKQRRGDVQAAKIIGTHDNAFRECLKRYGGFEETNPGDEFFATFDLPSEAVRCALAFVDALGSSAAAERVQVRVGIHMGETTRLDAPDSGKAEVADALSAGRNARRRFGARDLRQVAMGRRSQLSGMPNSEEPSILFSKSYCKVSTSSGHSSPSRSTIVPGTKSSR